MMTDRGGEADPAEPETSRTSKRDLTRREALGAGLAFSGAVAFRRPLSRLGSVVERAASIAPRGADLEAIEHVVFVMQENRSFDHYFGTYRGVRGFDDHRAGLSPFAQPVPGSSRQVLPYHLDRATLQAQCAGSADIPIHDWRPQHESWAHGRMDQFVATHARFDGEAQAPLVMGYFERSDLSFYYALADAFTICDAYHCSVIGPTMPNRLYSLSATIDPTGANGGPVLSTPSISGLESAQAVGSVRWPTMPEALSDHGVSWKVYQQPGTSVGPDQRHNLSLAFNALLYFEQYLADPNSTLYQQAFLPVWPTEFMADVSGDTLPQVSWILPPLVDSEHPSAAPANGEGHVSKIIQALVAQPDLWAKTVVVVTFDENGGFFDHVAPPTPPPGTTGEYVSDIDLVSAAHGIAGPIGLGFRVPTLIVSPFSRGGYVNSDVFDHTSLLRLLETRFGVPVPNLTRWRRATAGDLTSTLDLGAPDVSVPALPAAPIDGPTLAQACPDNDSDLGFLDSAPGLSVPLERLLPHQEPGTARRR
jgi:phospholipase C